MKRALLILLAALLLIPAAVFAEEPEEWVEQSRSQIKVGNPTPLRGRFFAGTAWGGTTSDLDVQDLLHAYSPVIWDSRLGRFRYDHSVVQNAVSLDGEDGSRTYVLVFYEDLAFSDGTPITAWDYAFSLLLQMDPAVTESGGKALNCSWIAGSDEYLSGAAKTLSGVRVITDHMMQIRVKAEALPYFYELSRLMIRPYPIAEIAPGVIVFDEGTGVRLSEPLTAETLKKTVLDPKTGYLSHPKTVSGPYLLESYDGQTATLQTNPKYKGNEQGYRPRILKLRYTQAYNSDMIRRLGDGEFDLLNKVTMTEAVREGLTLQGDDGKKAMTRYGRTGLTLIRFMEKSEKVQDTAVRKAIALCFDRDGLVRAYTGPFGRRADGLYGIGQWMYQRAQIPLNGQKIYQPDPGEAIRLLDEAGWNLDEAGEPYREGVRYKRIDGRLVGLRLVMGMPESEEMKAALEKYLFPGLEKAGIRVTLQPVNMAAVQEAYGEEGLTDLLLVGENFSAFFDPELLAPAEKEGELSAVREELYAIAKDMVRTEPEDTDGFMKKWERLQVRISETLPVLPVYSNEYFDFYSRELHNYRITEAVTWGEAIVKSWISDAEVQDGETQRGLQEELEELKGQYAGTETEAWD